MATVDMPHDCEFGFQEGPERADRVRTSFRSGVRRGLHRIAEVRRQQRVSLRTVARRLRLPITEVRRQEHPSSDLKVSEIQRWQQVLEVPIAELLVEADGQLSAPVLERSRMIKLMKTAAAIREQSHGTAVGRLVTMLIGQLVEVMPEVADVTPWPEAGQRRTLEDYGRTARYPVPSDLFAR
jgi:transcriptional regulator with XRE-family HTH domain